jgi:hypothetical protein
MTKLIESESWTTIRKVNNWIMIDPDISVDHYKINTFDDGYKQFEKYENIWKIYGSWKGKYALVNANDSEVRLQSISQWKTNLIR